MFQRKDHAVLILTGSTGFYDNSIGTLIEYRTRTDRVRRIEL